MSSHFQSLVNVQQQFAQNDVSIATVTVVVYDYIITFPNEVEYIWVREQAF